MGKRLTASEETRLLQDTIRLAHEATQALNDAIRQANALTPALVQEFEETHHRELAQLSNHMTAEGNRAAADLNASVDAARAEILRQLTAAELILDKDHDVVRLLFNRGRFDDQVPMPFPNHESKETTE